MDSLGLTWTHLVALGLTWTHLGFTWIHFLNHLDSLGFISWFHLDSLGLTWTHSDSLGLTWTHLDSLGFTWTHLDSLGFTWTHLDSRGKRERPLGGKGKGKGTAGGKREKREKGKGGRHDLSEFPPYNQSARTHARTETKIDFPVGLPPPTSDKSEIKAKSRSCSIHTLWDPFDMGLQNESK